MARGPELPGEVSQPSVSRLKSFLPTKMGALVKAA